MAWYRGNKGSGAMTETVLWTNQSPTSAFAAQNVTLSESIDDYNAIRIYWRLSTSDSTTAYIDVPKESLKTLSYASGHACIALNAYVSTLIWLRIMSYVDDTKINFSTSYRVNNTGSNTSYAIPTKICGLK